MEQELWQVPGRPKVVFGDHYRQLHDETDPEIKDDQLRPAGRPVRFRVHQDTSCAVVHQRYVPRGARAYCVKGRRVTADEDFGLALTNKLFPLPKTVRLQFYR